MRGNTNIHIGLTHGAAFPTREIAERCKQAEELGYDVFLIGDRPEFRDPFLSIHYALTLTSKIQVGTGIAAALLYAPWVLRRTFRTLQEQYGDRTLFAVGTGDSRVLDEHGVFRPRIKKMVTWIREFHSSDKHQWKESRLKLFLGTQSPRLMQEVDHLVDGYLLNTASVTEIKYLQKYTKKPIYAYGFLLLREFSKERTRMNQEVVELMLRSTSLKSLQRKRELHDLVKRVKKNGFKSLQEDEKELVLQEFTFYRDQDEVISHIKALIKLGVKGVIFAGVPREMYAMVSKKRILQVI